MDDGGVPQGGQGRRQRRGEVIRAVTLGVTQAEAQAVRTFIIRAVCPKVLKVMALKAGFLVVGMVKLQLGKSELTVQGSSCADFIHQLGPS